MRTRLFAACSLAASLVLPSVALGWNDVGHMTGACLAYRRLDAADRASVDAILRQHPYYANMLVDDLPPGVEAGEWAFMKAASWPDAVRPPTPAYPATKPAGATDYHRASWHYKDVPFSPDKSFAMPAEPASKTTNAGGVPADAIAALAQSRRQLADAQASPAERAVALCWIEHLIGDVHQPLHGCTMYTTAYPKGDQGGNAQSVQTDAGVQNLHAIWDNGLGTANGYVAIDAMARDLTLDPRCDVAKLKEYAEHKEAEQWLAESHALAVAYAYLDGKLKTVPSASLRRTMPNAPQPTSQPVEVPRLPSMYLANVREVSRVRDSLAAARLADAIHAALASK